MRRLPVALLTLGVSVVLGACANDTETTSPRSISPQQVSNTVVAATGSCDFSAVKADARAFFKSGNDAVFGYISDMQTAFKNGGAVSATPLVWPILKQIASERLTSAQAGTADNGAQLVIDAFNCTTSSTDSRLAATGDFVLHGSLALSAGIFEVRGDASGPTGPARAYLSSNGRVLASPVWGVQAPAGGWPSGAFLIYGYPKLLGVASPATGINTNGTTPYDAFELGKIPSAQLVGGFLVGICTAAVTTDINGKLVAGLLVHNSVNQLNASPTTLCNTSIADAAPASWTTRLGRLVAAALSPKPAFAQFSSFIGGLPSDWSPFSSGKFSTADVTLTFSTQPVNGTTSTPIDIEVLASKGTDPVAGGVLVTLSIAGNFGSPAYFVDTVTGDSSKTVTREVNSTGPKVGIAVFDHYVLTKAGGYLTSAVGSIGGLVSTSAITSNSFQIQNK